MTARDIGRKNCVILYPRIQQTVEIVFTTTRSYTTGKKSSDNSIKR